VRLGDDPGHRGVVLRGLAPPGTLLGVQRGDLAAVPPATYGREQVEQAHPFASQRGVWAAAGGSGISQPSRPPPQDLIVRGRSRVVE
jgi:hypothetical protein